MKTEKSKKNILITEVNKIVALAAARSILLRMRGSERVFKAQILVSSGRKPLKRDYTNASKYYVKQAFSYLHDGMLAHFWCFRVGLPYPNFGHFMPYYKLGHAGNGHISEEIVIV